MISRALPILAACAVAACSEGQVSTSGAPAPARSQTANGPAPAVASAPVALALDPEGLRAVNTDTGSTRPLAFGQPGAQLIEVATRVLGSPPRDRGTNGDCGAGPLDYARWEDGLMIWIQDGAFAGWGVNKPGPTTMSGLGVGSTRAQLDDAYAAEVSEGTLGTEFSAGDLHGVLDGPQGKVTHLWAGVSCNFG